MTILAKPAILEARTRGDLLIEPFDDTRVKNCSVDVTLGEWYWPEQTLSAGERVIDSIEYDGSVMSRVVKPFADADLLLSKHFGINPYDPESRAKMWGIAPKRAAKLALSLPGVPAGSRVIVLEPSQNILAHTHEFIGGSNRSITTMMKARSSIGRSQVTICRCAGWGDIGFCNRYVLEISNSGLRPVLLVVGRAIGQVVFLETTGISDESDSYFTSGKYQTQDLRGRSFADLEKTWSPEMMLPKLWMDQDALAIPVP